MEEKKIKNSTLKLFQLFKIWEVYSLYIWPHLHQFSWLYVKTKVPFEFLYYLIKFTAEKPVIPRQGRTLTLARCRVTSDTCSQTNGLDSMLARLASAIPGLLSSGHVWADNVPGWGTVHCPFWPVLIQYTQVMFGANEVRGWAKALHSWYFRPFLRNLALEAFEF